MGCVCSRPSRLSTDDLTSTKNGSQRNEERATESHLSAENRSKPALASVVNTAPLSSQNQLNDDKSMTMLASVKQSSEDKLTSHPNTTQPVIENSFFTQASNFEITGGEFVNIQGNQVIYNPPPISLTKLHPWMNSSQFFTGREDYLQRLKVYFDPSINNENTARKSILLYGMGGIGKTQICLKFIEETDAWFTDIFWIDASTEASLTSDFLKIAEVKNLMPSAPFVMQWVSNLKANWLMVFDNADSGHEVIRKHIPPGRQGNMIITSRNKILEGITSTSLAVDELQVEEATSLLLKSGRIKSSLAGIARKVVQTLGCVPLAIDQAGAYMHICDQDPDDYLNLYEKHRKKLLSERGASGYKYSAYETWEISLKEIENRAGDSARKDAEASNVALTLLNMFSFLHYQQISAGIFSHAAENHLKMKVQNSLPQIAELLDLDILCINEDSEWDEFKFMSGIQILLSFSLIKNNKKTYSIHPLVHTWVRDRLSKSVLNFNWHRARALLSYVVRPEEDEQNYSLCIMLLPHLKAVYDLGKALKMDIDYYDDEFHRVAFVFNRAAEWVDAERFQSKVSEKRMVQLGKEDQATLKSLKDLAIIYQRQGEWEKAENLLVEVVDTYKLKFGEDAPETLKHIMYLAVIHRNQGRWSEAEKLQKKIFETNMMKLGLDHADTIDSMISLALTYQKQGRWNEAGALQEKAVQAKKKEFGDNHADTLARIHELAVTYRGQGRVADAENLQLKVVEARKLIFGEDHPDTIGSMTSLAITYQNQRRWNDAEKLQVQVMETSKMKLGEDHLDTLASIDNLGVTYQNLGKLVEAEELLFKVAEAKKKKFGEDHYETIKSLNNLASTYQRQKKWDKAEILQQKVIEASKIKLGTDHPETLTSMNNLSITYQMLGRWKEAEELLLQVVEARKLSLGNNHPETLRNMSNLEIMYVHQERWDDAEELQKQVLGAYRLKFGEDHSETLRCMSSLAITYQKLEKWNEAEKLQVYVMEKRKAELGKNHPSTLLSMNNLAFTYQNQGRLDDAEGLQVPVMDGMRNKHGESHPEVLKSMENLAITYQKQGRWNDAEKLHVHVMEGMKKHFGNNHPETLKSMDNVAITYEKQGRLEEAQNLHTKVKEVKSIVVEKKN